MIGFGCPGVDLNAIFQSNNQEFDPLIADNLEVDGSLEIAHIHPAVPLLCRDACVIAL